jgi:hypothetical protein
VVSQFGYFDRIWISFGFSRTVSSSGIGSGWFFRTAFSSGFGFGLAFGQLDVLVFFRIPDKQKAQVVWLAFTQVWISSDGFRTIGSLDGLDSFSDGIGFWYPLGWAALVFPRLLDLHGIGSKTVSKELD